MIIMNACNIKNVSRWMQAEVTNNKATVQYSTWAIYRILCRDTLQSIHTPKEEARQSRVLKLVYLQRKYWFTNLHVTLHSVYKVWSKVTRRRSSEKNSVNVDNSTYCIPVLVPRSTTSPASLVSFTISSKV